MTTDQDDEAVFIGFWIDWDRGRVRGSTLTLRDSHAVPLVAGLVILVTLAGGRSWHLFRLIWHSFLRAKELHSQTVRVRRRRQQVLIRNSETAAGATIVLVEEWLSFGIKGVLRECSWKDVLLAGFTVGHWIIFLVLGVLVSQIVLGKVVVSKSLPNCGQWLAARTVDTGENDPETTNIFNELQLNKTTNSDNYVRSCYPGGGSEGRVDCNKLMLQFVPHQVLHAQSCPYNASACFPDTKSAITLLSSNISMSQMGINSNYAKKISIQRRSTCAVMDANTFKTTDFDPTEEFSGTAGYTFYKDSKTGKASEFIFSLRNQFSEDYKLMALYMPAFSPAEIVPAIRPNTSTGLDVTIILLQGLGIKFVKEQDDIWFAAHQELEYNIPMPVGFHRYQMDDFLAMIACNEQFRFCSETTKDCTPYQGLLRYQTLSEIPDSYSILFGPTGLKANTKASWNFDLSAILVENIMTQSALSYSIQGRGQAALQASRYISEGLQTRLRREQWKFELEYWFMMALARLQLEILNTIDKPSNLDESMAKNLWAADRFTGFQSLCGRIKFRSPRHTSLSALGLVLILVFSGVLLVASGVGAGLYWMEWMGKWRAVLEWRRDDVLALLKNTEEEVLPEVLDSRDVERTSIVIGDKSLGGQ